MNKLFTLIFFFYISGSVMAQNSRLSAGIEGGFGFNAVPMAYDTPSYSGTKYAVGPVVALFMGGPFLVYNFNSWIGLKTAVWFMSERQTGTWVNDPDFPATYGYGRYTNDYFSSEFRIPLFIRYSISLPRKNRCFIDFGPSFSFLNSRQEIYKFNDSLGNIHVEKDLYKGHALALSAGFGIIVPGNGNFNWSFEGIYALNTGPVEPIGNTFFGEVYLLCSLNFDLGPKKTRWKSNNCTRF